MRGRKGTHAKLLERAKKSGYVRVRIDGNLYETFEYAIEIKIEQLSDEFYNKDDKDVEQENKSVKTQNKARDCR